MSIPSASAPGGDKYFVFSKNIEAHAFFFSESNVQDREGEKEMVFPRPFSTRYMSVTIKSENQAYVVALSLS